VTESILSAQPHFTIKGMAQTILPDAYKSLQKPPLPLAIHCIYSIASCSWSYEYFSMWPAGPERSCT